MADDRMVISPPEEARTARDFAGLTARGALAVVAAEDSNKPKQAATNATTREGITNRRKIIGIILSWANVFSVESLAITLTDPTPD
jgi:hypothetical protein